MGLLEREKKYLMIFDISNFSMPKHTNVIDITFLLYRNIQMSYMIGGKQW